MSKTRQMRSGFVSKFAIVFLMLGIVTLVHAQPQRQLGTVGPPQRKTPQRQTAAESIPPLPLPATPMRRSEPKAEPAAPLFVAKLAYGTTQDYTPNRGDLQNLLFVVRHKLDAWYGQQIISTADLITMSNAGQPCQIPMIYITGYEAFTFSEPEIAAMREYVIAGGTLVGDATLGSPLFTTSFRTAVAQMFPERKLELLQMDHPIMRAFYAYDSVHYFTVNQGVTTTLESPPQFMGMNVAARTAIILSPFDMSCGWDGFHAPAASDRVPGAARTMAMVPADAKRMGVNLVAYIAAERNFAKSQAITREITGQQTQQRAAVTIGHLKHQGDWNPDPNSLHQLIRLAAQQTSIPMSFDLKPVNPSPQELLDTPTLIMTGMNDPGLSEQAIVNLKRHLQAGGVLFINNTSGFALFDRQVRALIAQIIPDKPLEKLPSNHPIFSSLYTITDLSDMGTGSKRAAELFGVTLNDRLVIIYSPNDTLGMLKAIHDPFANAYDTASAQKLALNILCFALKQ